MQGEGAQVVQTPGGVQASVMLIADPIPGVVHTVKQERLESDVPGNSYASFGCDVKSCVLSKLTGGLIALSEMLFSLLSHNRVDDPAYTASK